MLPGGVLVPAELAGWVARPLRAALRLERLRSSRVARLVEVLESADVLCCEEGVWGARSVLVPIDDDLAEVLAAFVIEQANVEVSESGGVRPGSDAIALANQLTAVARNSTRVRGESDPVNVVDVKTVARRAGVTDGAVRQAAQCGRLRGTRDHRGWWSFAPADVDAWLCAREESA